jgi:ferritin-like metal-binding protein YciE
MAATDSTPEPGPDADIDELQADIEQTRAELGQTVSALSDKFDVKGRAEAKVADTKDAVAQRAHEVTGRARANPAVPAALVLAALAGIAATIWWRRRST